MTYMTPENAQYLDVLRQLNPMQYGPGGGGVGGTAVGSPVTPLANPLGAGPTSGTIPNFGAAPNVVADAAQTAAPDAAGGIAGAGRLAGILGGGEGGLSTLGTAARIAGIGARGAAADAGMTGLAGTGYSLLPLGVGIGTDMLADRGLKAVGLPHKTLLADVGKGAAGGAAAGTAAGLLGGPFAEITVPAGAAVGALGGAAIGGISHLFGGGNSNQQKPTNWGQETTSLVDQAKQAGLDPQMASNLYNQYGIYLRSQLANTRGTDQEQATRQQAYQKLATNIQSALAYQQRYGAQGQQSVVPGYQMGPQDYAAMQAISAAYMKPYTDQSMALAGQEKDILGGLANKIGGSTGAAIQAQATAASSAAQRTALAYGAQVQMAPTMYAFQEQQAQEKALASQLQSQAIAQYVANGGQSGPTFDWTTSSGLNGLLPGAAAPTTTKKK